MERVLKIAIGSDHAGYEYKEIAKKYLTQKGYACEDFGAHSLDSVDYPDFAHPVAERIEGAADVIGILICGSANGVAMAANKHQGVRAAICWMPEIASLSRQHNDANVCCIPARFVTEDEMNKILDQFLTVSFEGGRHHNRVQKIACV